jgi:hypothetical protein
MDAAELDAIDPEHVPKGDERTLLLRYLDFYRGVMLRKAEGLTQEQLGRRVGVSELTVGGLLKHMAFVEDQWFHERLLGRGLPEPWASIDWEVDRDWDFHSAVDDEPAELVQLYLAACDRSRAVVDEVPDLDTVSLAPNGRGHHFSVRWILLHMIEETARHAGHADILRENIDGMIGD